MHGVRFHIDRRALIPRSFIGDMLARRQPADRDPRKVRRVLDLCTGSGCLAILAALRLSARDDRRRRSVGRRARARAAQRGDPPAGRSHHAPSRRSLPAARPAALRPDPQQPALCRCRAAWRSCRPSTATSRAWRWPPATTGSIWSAASSPRRRGICARTAASCARSAAAARRSNAPIPTTPFVWLDTEQSQGEVFWLPADIAMSCSCWDSARIA